MNTLSLDDKDERFSMLVDCPDGERATVEVTGTVRRAKDGTFSMEVEEAEYEVAEEVAEEKPMKPEKGGPDHPAVMVLVEKKK